MYWIDVLLIAGVLILGVVGVVALGYGLGYFGGETERDWYRSR